MARKRLNNRTVFYEPLEKYVREAILILAEKDSLSAEEATVKALLHCGMAAAGFTSHYPKDERKG